MGFKVIRALSITLALTASTDAVISESGRTVVVNGINYYVAPEPVSIIDATADMLKRALSNGVDLIPLTVFADLSSSFTTTAFRFLVGNYTASDDVFNIGFLQGNHTTLLPKQSLNINFTTAIYLKHIGSSPTTVKYPLGAAFTE